MTTVTLVEYLKMLQDKGFHDVPDGLISVDRLLELLELERQTKAAEEWKVLKVVLAYCPPEPIDWPWTDEDQTAELDNRRPEVCF